MGLLDNFIQRVANEIVKAAPKVTDLANQPQGYGQQGSGYGTSVGLERNPNSANVPFAPGLPIIPGAINPLRPDGRPDPRRFEFQVAQNINITETRLVPFKTLRAAADQIDILRRCVEVLKQKMVGLDWDVVLSDDSTEAVIADTGLSAIRAQQVAKDKFSEEIDRIRQFWKTPDVSNGLIFSDWLNMALEEILVVDAWAVWAQKSVGGGVAGLQILDGTTIKPLIDDRGMRPLPPYAAFQQILFGFPRSEFSAADESVAADGEFSSDELAYMIRNRRTTSVYGYSPVERALPLADMYLRRQQWLRAEFTDGVIPSMMFATDATFGGNPDLLRAYENVFNDDLAGQTEQRKRARLLPAGITPIEPAGYDQKFSDMFDNFLVNSICGHFGIMPSEIGVNPKSGLGGAGFQDGEAQSSEVIGLVPLAEWVGRMLSHLSYVYLGMPRELEFKFMPSQRNDDLSAAQADDIRLKNGTKSLNEVRASIGLPLIESEEADQPILFTPAGTFFMTPDGVMDLASGSTVDSTETDQQPEGAGQPPAADAPEEEQPAEPKKPETEDQTEEPAKPVKTKSVDTSDLQRDEAKHFMRWLNKWRQPDRPYRFQHLPATYAETLNKFIAVEDYEGARWYAERYLV
jgi:hypothetical protein